MMATTFFVLAIKKPLPHFYGNGSLFIPLPPYMFEVMGTYLFFVFIDNFFDIAF